jgi:putative copper export protein
MVGLVFSLLRQYSEFRDPFAPAMEEFRLLLTTPWGTVWKWAVGAAMLALSGFLLALRQSLPGWALASLAGAALGFFPGLTGHAAGAADARWLALVADALHVWAAGAWVGGLALVLYLVSIARNGSVGQGGASELGTLVPLFSPIAVLGAGILAVTGSVGAFRELGAVGALWSTGYGRVLTLKVALVGVVLALGAVNWRRLTPRLGTESGDRTMLRAAAIELLVANAVLLITAVLVRTSPGGH